MQLFFEITEGDEIGARFEIKTGMTIGRKNADILLVDPKVSIRHATVESRGNDSFILVDAGSSNGLKVDNVKVSQADLTPGVTIRVGRTVLKVIEIDAEKFHASQPAKTWDQAFFSLAQAAKAKLKPLLPSIQAFNPLIELKFVQGRHAGSSWLVGYGPRKVGYSTLDLRLEEPDTPDVCFELAPSKSGPQFHTEYPDKVKLNGKSVKQAKVETGDIIEIHKTKIEIHFKSDD